MISQKGNKKKGTKMKHVLYLLLIATLLVGQNLNVDETFEGISRIDMEIGSGDCIIVKSKNDKVRVRSDFEFKNEDSKPIIEKRGSKLVIRERRSRNNGVFWNERSSKAEWKLEIPNGLMLEFSTGSGDVEVSGVEFTEIELNSGSGKIKCEQVSGEARINTGSGRITLTEHKGDIKTNTGSGNITLTKTTGIVSGNTGSGDIKVEGSVGGFKLNTGSGEIELLKTDIVKRSMLNTGSGEVLVSLSKALTANLSMNAGSGDVTLEYNGNPITGYIEMKAKRERRIRAPFKFDRTEKVDHWGNDYIVKSVTIKKDDPEITLATGSGRVTIKE